MGIYSVQHILHNVTGLPEDDVVNTLHFDVAGAVSNGEAATIGGYVAASFFDARAGGAGPYLEDYIGPGISRVNLPDVKVYDAQAPGSPLWVGKAAGMRAAVGTIQLPHEVACCLSFRGAYFDALEEAPDDADPDALPERPRSRRRGRIFLGPLGSNAQTAGSTTGRPTANLQTAALNLATRLGDVGDIAPGVEWVVYSRENEAVYAVTDAWCDNAFDTQRRRGVAPTARESIAIVQ
jgi:hypothetical protein